MKVVLDTNILLVSISDRSSYHQIFKAFLESKYSLCLTTEILLEYGELLGKFFSEEIVGHTFELLENSPNVELITRYFSFGSLKLMLMTINLLIVPLPPMQILLLQTIAILMF